jgi:hypothetical protein
VLQIPFTPDEYRQVGFRFGDLGFAGLTWDTDIGLDEVGFARAWDHVYGDKNRYAMNNNGARNVALAAFRSSARWVLPWDGNTFLTESAWSDLLEALESEPWRPVFVVPMARITDNAALFADDFRPAATEEPQLVFRSDVLVAFDESYRYGRRPKVELLLRLGVPGPWERWSKPDPWETPLPKLAQSIGWRQASWVARLASGESALEKDIHLRGIGRREAVRMHLHGLDVNLLARNSYNQLNNHRLLVFDEDSLVERKSRWQAGETESSLLVNRLVKRADRVILFPPPTLGGLVSAPKSAQAQDYFSLGAPWALQPFADPPTRALDEDGPWERSRQTLGASTQDNRWALQRVFDETLLLTLAATFSGKASHWGAAAQRVRTWFIDPDTRMNPHLKFARIRPEQGEATGTSGGIIDFQDVYLFLDAVRLLQQHQNGEWLSNDDLMQLRSWFSVYLRWLSESPQGKTERASSNAHGPWYDLQIATIAAWLGDYEAVQSTVLRASERGAQQLCTQAAPQSSARLGAKSNESLFRIAGWQELALAMRNITGVPDPLGVNSVLVPLVDDILDRFNIDRTKSGQQRRLRHLLFWPDVVGVFDVAHRYWREI